jgi:hypothetical protein
VFLPRQARSDRYGLTSIFPDLGTFPKRSMASLLAIGPWGYKITSLLWGIPVLPESFEISTWLFLRLLGVIYLVAFASFGVQALGLIGSHGILPVAQYLEAAHHYLGNTAYWNLPTIFWLNSSDTYLQVGWIVGACLSVFLLVGLSWRTILIALFALYLSLELLAKYS